jgi:hypothetical protein
MADDILPSDDSLRLAFTFCQFKELEWKLKKQLNVIYDMALLSGEMSQVLHQEKKGQKLIKRWSLLVQQLM